jgi:hypothetical protein
MACLLGVACVAAGAAACGGGSGANAPMESGAADSTFVDGESGGDSPGDSSSEQDAPAHTDDAGSADADGSSSGGDSGLSSDPGAVTCGNTLCPDASGDPPMNQIRAYCCTHGPNTGDPISQMCEYANLGACESGIPYYCDETSDCNAGLFCCMSKDIRPWTACQSTCTGVMLCKSSGECNNGQKCVPATCDGQHLGTCGPLSSALAMAFGCQ